RCRPLLYALCYIAPLRSAFTHPKDYSDCFISKQNLRRFANIVHNFCVQTCQHSSTHPQKVGRMMLLQRTIARKRVLPAFSTVLKRIFSDALKEKIAMPCKHKSFWILAGR
ncbi:hypothetical protein BC936DRAFT_136676, partial [Jimgerdemannia flammicorona]